MFLDILYKSIERKQPNSKVKKAVELANNQLSYYTGKGQDKMLLSYRERETVEQKDQRKRLYIARTKHVIRTIENIYNQLDKMDKPAVNIVTENDKVKSELENFIYQNNLDNLAFERVKYYNLVDANSFLTCRKTQFDDIIFQPVTSHNLYDFYFVNNKLKWVIFEFERDTGKEKVKDYELYHESGYLILENIKGKTIDENTQTYNGYIVTEQETKRSFAFRLGYMSDLTTDMQLCSSIIDSASELIRALITQGGEHDSTLATQGITKQFAYAERCTYQAPDNIECYSGYLNQHGAPTGKKCPNCMGTGLNIHTSSQDILLFPMPQVGQESPLKLSELIHTQHVPDSILNGRSLYLKELEKEIVMTVFNNAVAMSPSEIQVTATEKVIELQGVYAALNQFGKQVSECFIWMVECVGELMGFDSFEVLHGYTLELKLESVESLSEKRKRLIDANAPHEVISALDLAILKKQHIDSPATVNRFVIWQRYKPFNDKSENAIMTILSGLSNTNYYKILYTFWGQIKTEIELKYGDAFYKASDDQRRKYIDDEVSKIKIVLESDQPNRLTLDNIDFA